MKERKGKRYECCGKLLGANWKACPLCGERIPEGTITEADKLLFEFETLRRNAENSARSMKERADTAYEEIAQMDHNGRCLDDDADMHCLRCRYQENARMWRSSAGTHAKTALKYAWRQRVVEDLVSALKEAGK